MSGFCNIIHGILLQRTTGLSDTSYLQNALLSSVSLKLFTGRKKNFTFSAVSLKFKKKEMKQ